MISLSFRLHAIIIAKGGDNMNFYFERPAVESSIRSIYYFLDSQPSIDVYARFFKSFYELSHSPYEHKSNEGISMEFVDHCFNCSTES